MNSSFLLSHVPRVFPPVHFESLMHDNKNCLAFSQEVMLPNCHLASIDDKPHHTGKDTAIVTVYPCQKHAHFVSLVNYK